MQSISINERVECIKGNVEDINRLVEEYKPFIASCVEKETGRYVRYGEDDELSIGLIAFAEAINTFDNKKGSFLSFAQNVIKRRLIDYYRKEKRHLSVIPLYDHYKDSEDEDEKDMGSSESISIFQQKEAGDYRRMEIEQLKEELMLWGITFSDLVQASPKHKGTKKIYTDIVRYLMAETELIKNMKLRKTIPVAEIEKATGIHRKKIERARKYIIAVVLITTGDYLYIRDYVDWGVME